MAPKALSSSVHGVLLKVAVERNARAEQVGVGSAVLRPKNTATPEVVDADELVFLEAN